MNHDEPGLRESLVAAAQRLDSLGLNRGSTGNLSHRCGHGGQDGMLITPTGMGADDLRPEELVWVGWNGEVQGEWQPSSEWHFHRASYLARPDLNAVVHTHATHATALACLDRPLPAFHYMVAVAGGDDVPLVPYATFGGEALARGVAEALAGRDACLMAQHGMTSCGPTMARALKVMEEIEALCRIYLLARAVGEPPVLPADEMKRVLKQFKAYGRRRASAARKAG